MSDIALNTPPSPAGEVAGAQMQDSASSIPINLRIVRKLDELEALATDWIALHDRATADSPFLHHTWLSSWCRIFLKRKDSISVLVLSRGDTVIGIAPFYIRSQSICAGWPRRVLRLIGTGEPEVEEVSSEMLDILCLPGEEAAVSEAIAKHLDQIAGGWDTLVFTHLLETSVLVRHLAPALDRLGHTVTQADSGMTDYYQDLPADHDLYVKHMKKNRRENYRRNLNIHNLHEGKLELAQHPVQVAMYRDDLVRFHRARWAAAGSAGTFSTPRNLAFHAHFLPRALAAGLVQLSRVIYGGRCVSVIYDLFYRGVWSYYQTGVDTANAPTPSPGSLHIELAIQRAIQVGGNRYDMLASGTGTYKDLLGVSQRPLLNQTVYNRRAGGRMACLQDRLSAWLRARSRPLRDLFRPSPSPQATGASPS